MNRKLETFRDKRQLWRKPFHVVGFFLEEGVGYELGEVGILDAQLLEAPIQVPLHIRKPSWLQTMPPGIAIQCPVASAQQNCINDPVARPLACDWPQLYQPSSAGLVQEKGLEDAHKNLV